MMRSLRARLLVWTLGTVTALLAGFGFLVYQTVRGALSSDLDEILVTTARTVCGFVEQNQEDLKVEIDDRQVPEFQRAVRPDYFQMWREDGRTLAQSASIRGAGLTPIDGPPDQFVFRSLTLPDGRPGRSVGISFVPKADEDLGTLPVRRRVTLVVARETAALDAEIARLRWLLVAATAGTIAVALAVGAVVVRHGLRPLDRLAARISAIRYDALAASIPTDRMPAEMAPVVERLNDLLLRLEAAFRRERAFSADVAHELRTPLAGLRCTLEVALARPRAEDEYRQAISECLEIVSRTQKVIDHLLMLARFEEGKRDLRQETVRLAELVDCVWRPLADAATRRGITVANRIPAALACVADRENLQLILANLLENAAEYTNERGRITILAEATGDRVAFSVANTGCRLTEDEVGHIFERFWRGDKARSDTGVHCGLGLVLVQRAVAALGGEIHAEAANGLFTMRLDLPRGWNVNEQGGNPSKQG